MPNWIQNFFISVLFVSFFNVWGPANIGLAVFPEILTMAIMRSQFLLEIAKNFLWSLNKSSQIPVTLILQCLHEVSAQLRGAGKNNTSRKQSGGLNCQKWKKSAKLAIKWVFFEQIGLFVSKYSWNTANPMLAGPEMKKFWI